MSRVGKKIIELPEKVEAKIEGSTVKVKGPLGELQAKLPAGLGAEAKDRKVAVKTLDGYEGGSALYGATQANVANMVEGVSKGFSKVLEIVGLGFRATEAGGKLTMTLGFSHPVEFTAPKGIKLVVDAKANTVTVTGIDKGEVGSTAARIRSLRKPEPYKGTGIKYKGEHIVRKAGKTAATAGGKK